MLASYRKRNGKWQVQVRQANQGAVSKTFLRKQDAVCWAREQEILMQTGKWGIPKLGNATIQTLIREYMDKVTPQKRGRLHEERRLKRLLTEQELMSTRLADAQPHIFARFRDQRLIGGARTCQYDLVLLRHAWNIARVEWGWPLHENPLSKIRFPRANPARERRLRAGEYERLLEAAEAGRSWYLAPLIVLAVETAMRRGELMSLTWDNIDDQRARIFLPLTKNGRSRWVPLTPLALACLRSLNKRHPETVFPVTDNAFRHAWDRLKKRTGIEGLTFHDLRHEAISRMFDDGFTIPHVMAITGHRTASQLFRYVQLPQ